MKDYLLFLRKHPGHIGFGFTMTFFSSLGQTFLISMYVPYILKELELSNSIFGTVYAFATISSSILLMFFGGRIDSSPLKRYILNTVLIMSIATLVLGITGNILFLPIALLGMRFSGQGLMSHISQTTMGRYFTRDRGKALSLSSLGYAAGEMIFPVLVSFLIPVVGWRFSLMINAGLLIVLIIPALRIFPIQDLSASDANRNTPVTKPGRGKTIRKTVFNSSFWKLAPSIVLLSFTNTGIFFYQLFFAQSRGFTPELYSIVFSGYAITRFLFGLYGGVLIDKFSGRNLVPLMLIPITTGLIITALVPAKWSIGVFLFLAGISIGFSGPIKSATIAELHGTESLGAIRGIYTAFMVLGTALGPVVFGLLLDIGIGFPLILIGSALMLLLATLNSYRLRVV